MADRISTFTIAIDGDDKSLRSLLATVKTDFAGAVRDLESATKKVQLFGDIEQQAKDAKNALNLAQAAVALYADQVEKAKASGAGVSDALAKSLKDATTAANTAEKAYTRSQSSLAKLSTQLAKAGVDTKNLASEQIRLATALKQASTAQDVQIAKQTLGVKTLADVQPQIDKIRAAYITLANSGTLTQTALTAAWLKQKAAIFEAQQSVTGFRDILNQVKVPALALVAGLTAVGAAVASTVSKFNSFNDAVLKGSTVTNLTKAQLDNLAAGARDVAKEFGESAQTAIKATFDLIRGGVSPDNAISALRDAAVAAQGGLADLGTTAQLGITILQGYQETADELPKIYDQIAFAAHAGGASIDDLNANLGSLLPVANAAHIPFDELLASITVLQRAGLDTGQSVQVLKRLIAGFADPAVIAKLSEMGIAVDGLIGTLKQIGAKDFDLTKLRDLAPDAKSLTGVVALTKGYQNLETTLDGIRNKSEGVAAANSKIVDETAGDKVKKLTAAFDALQSAIGKLAANPAIISFITNVVDKLDALAVRIDTARQKLDDYQAKQNIVTLAVKAYTDAVDLAYKALGGAEPAQKAFNQALDDAAAGATASAGKVSQALTIIASAVAQQLAKAKQAADDAAKQVGIAASNLAKDVAAVQTAMGAQLEGIEDASKAAIAALGLQALTQQQVEDQTTAITIKAAADRLKVLQDSSAQVIQAFNAEAATRLALVAGNVDKTRELETQLAGERKAILQQYFDAYQKQVNDLTALETTFVQKIKTIDEQRIAINQNIEDRINAVRAGGLGAYAVYAQKVQQIEQLIQNAREQNALSEFDKAKEYLDKALQLSDGLGKAVTENGQEIVSAQRAQITVEGLLTSARNTYNQALDGSKAKALANKDATDAELKTAKTGLADAGKALDDIAAKYAKGLNVKIDADVTDAQTAVAVFDDAVESVDRILHIQIDLKAAQDSITTLHDNLKDGVTAGAQEGVTAAIALLKSIEKEENDPNIKFLTNDAAKQIDDLGGQIKHLEDLKVSPSVNVSTKGVPEATKQLDDLSKDRDVTLTVHVKAVGDTNALGNNGGTGAGIPAGDPGAAGFNRGGFVPTLQRLQRFAQGGAVFSGRKVPGAGNQDTFGARLESGSYVLRKSASAYYGDGLLGRLAKGIAHVRRFALGGAVNNQYSQYDPSNYIGGSGSNQTPTDTGIGIPDPVLPDDQAARWALIQGYITSITPAARQWDGAYWTDALKLLFQYVDRFQTRPYSAFNEQAVLNQARAIGLNLGITRGIKVGFDVDGRSWHKDRNVSNTDFGLASLGNVYEFYNKGGQPGSTDTVPAMLTPGEWVVNKTAVGRYGAGLFAMLNNMTIPRDQLARAIDPGAMISRLATPPRVHRFAEGGQVPGAMASATVPAVASRSITNNMTFSASAADMYSEANVRRYFLPVWNNIQRRSR